VRRLVEENHLDPAAIPASGREGRITKSDVVGFLGRKPGEPAPAQPAAVVAAAAPAGVARPGVQSAARAEQRVPMTRLRARIAQRLVEAQSTQALLTTFNEVDLSAAQELRARYKERFEKTHGVKLGFMSLFVKAAIEALKKFPVVNASVDGNDIIYHEFFDIGVAVSTDRGLIVPVVRDADRKSLLDVAREIARLGEATKSGKVRAEDLGGSTFTITSLGQQGGLLATPILNYPEVGILGVHRMKQRPVVKDGQIVIGEVMLLSLSFDHRIIDGHVGAAFAYEIIGYLEDPDRLFLEMA